MAWETCGKCKGRCGEWAWFRRWVPCERCKETGLVFVSAPSRVTTSDAAGDAELASLWVDTNGGEG